MHSFEGKYVQLSAVLQQYPQKHLSLFTFFLTVGLILKDKVVIESEDEQKLLANSPLLSR
jgi:hypothetical protein